MDIVTDAQRRALLENGRVNAARVAADGDTVDFAPVVKLFCPWGAGTWLLSELDPEDPDVAHGLCDPGLGFPELGGVRLSELAALRGPGGLRVARDTSFQAVKPLSAYASEARSLGAIAS